MTTESSALLTRLLVAVSNGDHSAREQLWSLIFDELRVLARSQLADESAGHRRQPTSLVHDAYLRLTQGDRMHWADRREFFAAAALAMRRIRIDDARKRKRLKRGGDGHAVPLDADQAIVESDDSYVLAVDEALGRLEKKDPRKAQVVMLRFFAELSVDECADVLGVSPKTVDNDWRYARAWLHAELSPESDAR